MGVFTKLKEVLFDVEEDEEIPVITKDEDDEEEVEERPLREENPIKEVKMPKDDFLDEIKTKEAQEEIPKPKKESNFNFPLDFEEDIPVRSRRDTFDDDDFVPRTSREVRREEPKRRDEYEYDYSRLDIRDVKKEEKNNFKPSPIISPVYGILDQNYTKDDVIVKNDGSKRKPNLDDVRKKAYSKKKTEEVEEKDEFEEPLKTLDEILIDKEDVKEEDIPKVKKKVVEEEEVVLDETLPIGVYDDELPDEPYPDEEEEETEVLEEEPKEEVSKEDELESDLFNLIDSMYEDKNEREEEEE